MVAFVLNHACQIAFKILFVFHPIFVGPFHVDFRVARHIFADARHTKASLFSSDGRAGFVDGDFRVHNHHIHPFQFREIFLQHVHVNVHEFQAHAHLRCRNADTIAGIHGFFHVGDEFAQIFVIFSHQFGFFSKHRLAIYIYRESHIYSS